MADTKISALSAATAAAAANEFAINEAGTSKKLSGTLLKAFMVGTTFNVKSDYAATGNCIEASDGACTASDATFTSATAAWVTADIGKAITIEKAGAPLTAPGAPTGTVVAGGNLDASVIYTYKITFADNYGETEAGTVSANQTTTGANKQVNLSAIPVASPSAGVVRRIYRTDGGGATYKYITTLNETDTTYNDGSADGSGSTAPSVNTTHRPLVTTILSINSTTSIELNTNAISTQTACRYAYGTDDTTAITNAITAVPATGGAVYFPPGNYYVSSGIASKSFLTLYGTGWGSKITGGGIASSGARSIIEINDDTNVHIENLHFTSLGKSLIDGRGAIWAAIGSVFGAKQSNFVNNFFERVGTSAIIIANSEDILCEGNYITAINEHGVYMNTVERVQVVNNRITSIYDRGIKFTATSRGVMSQNELSDCEMNAILLESTSNDNVVSFNVMRNSGEESLRMVSSGGVGNTIQGNNITNGGIGNSHVAPSGVGSASVRFYGGTPSNSFMGNTLVHGTGTGALLQVDAAADDFIIQNNIFRTTPTSGAAAIDIYADRVLCQGNQISDATASTNGIVIRSGATDCRILDNTIRSTTPFADSGTRTGVRGNFPDTVNDSRVLGLASVHSISSTTGTEITGLKAATVRPGTYTFDYYLIVRSATTTVGPMIGINFTGTAAVKTMMAIFADSSGSLLAETHAMDDQGVLGTGFIIGMANKAYSTTAPNMGTTVGVITTASDTPMWITGVMVVTAVGDLAIWHSSETATATSVEVGSSLLLNKTA